MLTTGIKIKKKKNCGRALKRNFAWSTGNILDLKEKFYIRALVRLYKDYSANLATGGGTEKKRSS